MGTARRFLKPSTGVSGDWGGYPGCEAQGILAVAHWIAYLKGRWLLWVTSLRHVSAVLAHSLIQCDFLLRWSKVVLRFVLAARHAVPFRLSVASRFASRTCRRAAPLGLLLRHQVVVGQPLHSNNFFSRPGEVWCSSLLILLAGRKGCDDYWPRPHTGSRSLGGHAALAACYCLGAWGLSAIDPWHRLRACPAILRRSWGSCPAVGEAVPAAAVSAGGSGCGCGCCDCCGGVGRSC